MPDTIIVGGGLCGLALAKSLQERGRDFTLYEARVTDRQYGATDVRRNGAISKCLKWGLERC